MTDLFIDFSQQISKYSDTDFKQKPLQTLKT